MNVLELGKQLNIHLKLSKQMGYMEQKKIMSLQEGYNNKQCRY